MLGYRNGLTKQAILFGFDIEIQIGIPSVKKMKKRNQGFKNPLLHGRIHKTDEKYSSDVCSARKQQSQD